MYLFTAYYGLLAIIAATLITYLIEILLLYIGIRNIFKIKLNNFKMIFAPMTIALLILTGETIIRTLNLSYTWIHPIYIFVSVILLIWFYRNELLIQWTKFKMKA
jgi:hypothetical protein